MAHLSFHSAFGDLTIFEEDGAVVALEWGEGANCDANPLLEKAKSELLEYFGGDRTQFSVPLKPSGTNHQKTLWSALIDVPYGQTVSYGDLAKKIGSGARAVGTACAKNPLPIFIPCHRVLQASGHLGNYSGEGGVETKAALLRLEGAAL